MNVLDFFNQASNYNNIANAIAKTHNILYKFNSPSCSISGGADSDIMLDMVHKLDEYKKVRYVWFNTGLEYQATKRHLDELEEKYEIKIERFPAVKPIPQVVKEFGQPFLSKYVSDRISRLQNVHFDFSDMGFDEMLESFPTAKAAVYWWHNWFKCDSFNINQHRYLKEFLIKYPPTFKISDKCCDFAKKRPIKHFTSKNYIDVQLVGVRKAEGGIRSMLKSCFTGTPEHGIFRPLLWFTNQDKEIYCKLFDVQYSDCYTRYGLKRTGCAGCPFNPNVFGEIEQVKDYEGGLITAAAHVFRESYEYTRLYREFCSAQRNPTLSLF